MIKIAAFLWAKAQIGLAIVAFMILQTHAVGPLETNNYIVGDSSTGECALIDVGIWPTVDDIVAAVEASSTKLSYIVLTHAHFDHAYWAKELKEKTGAQVLMHESEKEFVEVYMEGGRRWGFEPGGFREADELVTDGRVVNIGSLSLDVMHTPGHTPGSICLVDHEHKCVFSGDTLFHESVGRMDLPGGNARDLSKSIRGRLFALPKEYVVYPGHGPSTTIGHEREHNPFVSL